MDPRGVRIKRRGHRTRAFEARQFGRKRTGLQGGAGELVVIDEVDEHMPRGGRWGNSMQGRLQHQIVYSEPPGGLPGRKGEVAAEELEAVDEKGNVNQRVFSADRFPY